jgi:ATP-dependent Clp protease ATP-binding subunit ClpA
MEKNMYLQEFYSKEMNDVAACIERKNRLYGIGYIGSEHVLYGIMNAEPPCRAAQMLKEMNVSAEEVTTFFERTVSIENKNEGETPRLKMMLEKAKEYAAHGLPKDATVAIRPEHLLLACLREGKQRPTGYFYVFLQEHKIDEDALSKKIEESLAQE